MPLVSVLIPTYKRAEYLREAIRSAVRQTHEDVEILVLDDCSPDHTPEVVRGFSDDSRVRHFRNDPNRGIAANWQIGIGEAQGEYFCLLHDDDTLEPKFIEELLSPLTGNHSLILSFCDQWVINERGQRLLAETETATRGYRRDRLPEGPLHSFAETALVHTSIPAGGALYRRSLVTPEFVDPRARGSIDMWLLYQCINTGFGAYFVPERLMNYRLHPQGMSRSMPFEMIEGHIFRYRTMLEDPKIADLHGSIKNSLAEAFEWLGMSLLRDIQNQRARGAFRQAMAMRPTGKAFAGYLLTYAGGPGALLLKISGKMRDLLKG